jgi:hypothetical protein
MDVKLRLFIQFHLLALVLQLLLLVQVDDGEEIFAHLVWMSSSQRPRSIATINRRILMTTIVVVAVVVEDSPTFSVAMVSNCSDVVTSINAITYDDARF